VSAGGAPAQSLFGVCTVELRVDVFGGGSSWALQGGLTAGKLATLRATTSGCAGLDHITGRWVSGGSGVIPGTPRPCAGTICILRVRSQKMAAADFQAFARIRGGGIRRSNIVRVAWAGEGLGGDYTSNFRGKVNPGCHIALTGNRVTATNEFGETATGIYDPAGRTITLTAGNWPDATAAHPFIGRVSGIGGRIRIDWPLLADGGSGGFWLHD
jgi:hypothetical protein